MVDEEVEGRGGWRTRETEDKGHGGRGAQRTRRTEDEGTENEGDEGVRKKRIKDERRNAMGGKEKWDEGNEEEEGQRTRAMMD